MEFAALSHDWFDAVSLLNDEFEDSVFLVEPKAFVSIEEADRERLLTLRSQRSDSRRGRRRGQGGQRLPEGPLAAQLLVRP